MFWTNVFLGLAFLAMIEKNRHDSPSPLLIAVILALVGLVLWRVKFGVSV